MQAMQAFFYSSVEYRDWVLSRLLRHFDLPNKVGTNLHCTHLHRINIPGHQRLPQVHFLHPRNLPGN